MPFKIEVEPDKLKERKLFVATPMYSGMCTAEYTQSMINLAVYCASLGIKMKYYFITNESLITRARNYCVDEFLRSDYTHLMFIDADTGFNPKDVVFMLAMMGDEDPYKIVTAPCPKKVIAWEKVKKAVESGYADENPNELEYFAGDFAFNPIDEENVKLDEPVKVMEAGTGFMMIHREVFDKYREAYPDIMYKPDHGRSKNFKGDREIGMYFQAEIGPDKRYLSEDYNFCRKAKDIGYDIWMCPWMHLMHIGTHQYIGSLVNLAKINASPTV